MSVRGTLIFIKFLTFLVSLEMCLTTTLSKDSISLLFCLFEVRVYELTLQNFVAPENAQVARQ